jgi:hypothetical protein
MNRSTELELCADDVRNVARFLLAVDLRLCGGDLEIALFELEASWEP